MSNKVGRSCSTYFNGEQVEKLESEATEAGVGFNEIIKAKAVAKDSTVQVIHRFNLGNEVKENLFDIASFLLSISRSLETANEENLSPIDLTIMKENSDKALVMFEDALVEMKTQVAKQRVG